MSDELTYIHKIWPGTLCTSPWGHRVIKLGLFIIDCCKMLVKRERIGPKIWGPYFDLSTNIIHHKSRQSIGVRWTHGQRCTCFHVLRVSDMAHDSPCVSQDVPITMAHAWNIWCTIITITITITIIISSNSLMNQKMLAWQVECHVIKVVFILMIFAGNQGFMNSYQDKYITKIQE